MAYFSTEYIARAAGISPSAARYYLKKGAFTPQITEHRLPRHSRVYSWPGSALSWVRSRLTSRPISPAPSRLHWLTAAEAREIMGISAAHLRRLVARGHLRSRRVLLKTPKGAAWRVFIHAADAETYPSLKNERKKRMHITRPILLLRAWLILLGIESGSATRCLALWQPGADAIPLQTELGQTYLLKLDNPEGSPGLPSTCLPPNLYTDEWETALTAFRTAITAAEAGAHLLTIAADTVDLWSTTGPDRQHLQQIALPIPAAHG